MLKEFSSSTISLKAAYNSGTVASPFCTWPHGRIMRYFLSLNISLILASLKCEELGGKSRGGSFGLVRANHYLFIRFGHEHLSFVTHCVFQNLTELIHAICLTMDEYDVSGLQLHEKESDTA